MAMRAVVIAAFGVTAAFPALAAPERVGWASYHNERFGYSMAYPSSFLLARAEAGNGDGRGFGRRGGPGTVLVWASYEDTPIAADVDGLQSECSMWPPQYRVVRANKKPQMAAVSCTAKNGSIIYTKVFRCKDVATQLRFEYPKADSALWEPVVSEMSASLTGGCGET